MSQRLPSPEEIRLQDAINGRFMDAVRYIIAAGEYRTIGAVATSIDMPPTNMPAPRRANTRVRNATVLGCEGLCRVHGINGHWLLTGTGEMFVQQQSDLEKRMDALEKLVHNGL